MEAVYVYVCVCARASVWLSYCLFMWLHAVSVHICVCASESVCCTLNWAKSRTDQVEKVRTMRGGQSWSQGQLEVLTVTMGWESGSRRPAEEVKLFSEELSPNPFFSQLDLDLTRLFDVRPVEPICDWRTVLESLLPKPLWNMMTKEVREVFTGWLVILFKKMSSIVWDNWQ